MKPDYALSLSLDGIRFFCRVEEGWHLLGDVPLDHKDLDSALSSLRKRGEDHAGDDALCKIILPNDQIRYLTLSDFDGDQDEAIAAALAEATPYALDELAYDFVETPDGVQVAAVAKETLDEALHFAQEHGFHAVSFSAIPQAQDFDAEPFFGPTPIATGLLGEGETPEPDNAIVTIVSEGELPDTSAVPTPAPSFASSRLMADLAADQTANPAASAGKLGGASRNGVAATDTLGTAPTVQPADQTPAPNGAASSITAQEPRFDTATLIAGLKPGGTPKAEAAKPDPADKTPALSATDTPTPKTPKSAPPSAAQAASADSRSATNTATVGGKPRYLGIILLLVLMAFMAGVAVWSSIFSEEDSSNLLSPETENVVAAIEPATSEQLETTALPPVSNDTITDTAEIEAMDDNEGILIDPVLEAALPTRTGDALYAATGIWDRAPAQPDTPSSEISEAIYLASFEPMQQTHDAIALPTPESFGIDALIAEQNNPVAAGTVIELDERGLVIATPEGAISPEGVLVYLGKPASLPESFPDRAAMQLAAQVARVEEEVAKDNRLAAVRPKARPVDLTEQNERATLGGSTLSEIAGIRPRARPADLVKVVSIDPNAIAAATDQAVLASVRPRSRPANFASTVKEQQTRLASVAVPSSQAVAPSIPTTASVARNATQDNAIKLRKINLIGLYGSANDRRALVRLASGRYKKVKIGDRIDGGKVAAISDSELRYVKGGRTLVLKMPRG